VKSRNQALSANEGAGVARFRDQGPNQCGVNRDDLKNAHRDPATAIIADNGNSA